MRVESVLYIKKGFVYFILSTLLLSLQFLHYMYKSPQFELMDFHGWVFYLSAAISHAATFALVPYLLVYVPWVAITGKGRVPSFVHALLMAVINILACLNGYVFALYKFHINGFVLSLVFGEGADEIFTFDSSIYLFAVGMALFFVLLNFAMRHLSGLLLEKQKKAHVLPVVLMLAVMLLTSNLMHAYAAVVQDQPIRKSATHLPYYFPLTANGFMRKMGVVTPDDFLPADFGKRKNPSLCYPKQPLVSDSTAATPNIVLIALDSWNYRAFTPEVAPNIDAFAKRNLQFENHLSSSNGTKGSIFGLFYGISSFYWNDFDVSGVTPVLVDELQKSGYEFRTFPSATLNSPNFAKLLFYKVDGIEPTTEGKMACDRDENLTRHFVDYLDKRDEASNSPFFAFLFYDLMHSMDYPEGKAKKFLPSWEFADYPKLDNDSDPTPFWNLYRNCSNVIDSLVGIVLNKLEETKLMDNTIVVITGDHGQEFNENKHNYWGHGGNYTYPQIHVPFIVHWPDHEPKVYRHRTTHYDFSTTLLHDVFGVKNEVGDYSMGKPLTDTTFRNWHVAGDNLNYAFIVEGNTILEKMPSGYLEITDAKLKPIEGYKVNSKELNEAITRLNAFYK